MFFDEKVMLKPWSLNPLAAKIFKIGSVVFEL